LTTNPRALVILSSFVQRLVTLNRAEQCAVLDKLMPIAHRYGVQMRCCGDKGIVGYPITKSALIVSLRRVVVWNMFCFP